VAAGAVRYGSLVSRRPSFEHLLSPGRIGSLETRNRIVMSPMGSNLAEADGHLGERILQYYEARAKGGAGLLIVGVGAISFPAGACNPNQVAISDDGFLPGLTQLAQRVHAHGARIAIQLQHAGKVAVRDMVAGRPLWVPSAPEFKRSDLVNDLTPDEMERFVGDLKRPGAGMSFHEMSVADIADLVAAFAAAADRAKRAGFDGVELHAGHGYILSSFLSPASNRREDAYGGSHENRARFLVEAIRAAKDAVGADFPVWCRIDAKEFETPGGITVEDARRTAALAQAAGADAIHVSAYADPNIGSAFTKAPLVHQPGGYVDFARAIKAGVDVPVIAVGRIEPVVADRLIAEGGTDFVAMARKLLADPDLPQKLADGRPDDVRPCIYCYTCVGNIFLNASTCCAVNPATGREYEIRVEPAATPKHVLIAGGGPAGLEAARVAALRGHRVTLCEKAANLGGTLRVASLVAEDNAALAVWLERQVRSLPIELRLRCEVTPESIAEMAVDVLVVATGARRIAPAIPGVERAEVWSGDALRSLLAGGDASIASRLALPARLALRVGKALGILDRPDLARSFSRWWLPFGRQVVVVGAGLVGTEIAEFLSERGRTVTLVGSEPTLAAQMAPPRRWRVLRHLRESGVDLWTGARVESIDAEGVHFRDAHGVGHAVPADDVVLAEGAVGDAGLAERCAGVVPEIHTIGDCGGVGYIRGAIEDGARVARAL